MSAPSLEREIRRLLNKEGSPATAAENLISRWQKNLFDPTELATVAQFLLNSGLEAELLNEVRRSLQTKRTIPWLQFVAALNRAGQKWSETELKALRDGLKDQNMVDEFAAWPGASHFGATFEKRRKALAEKVESERKDELESLRDQLQFFRNQRMHEEEAATLQKLKALYPDDPEFKVGQQDFAERVARDILANYSSRATELTEELLLRAQDLNTEARSIKDLLSGQARSIAKKHPEFAYDLAVMFLFMEFHSDALEILEFAPANPQKDWLRLDLLLKARQYVNVLDEANRLELVFSNDPESTFAVTYARARALWGLGQASNAIDLMRSIVRVRPNYRSSRSLLLDWSGGEV